MSSVDPIPAAEAAVVYLESTIPLTDATLTYSAAGHAAAIRAVIAALKRERADNSDFMAFMQIELAKFQCCHEDGQHHSTPPMFWPELIRCIVERAVREKQAGLSDSELGFLSTPPSWGEGEQLDWAIRAQPLCVKTVADLRETKAALEARNAEHVKLQQLTAEERAAVEALRAADQARTPGEWDAVELWHSPGRAVVMHHESINRTGESVFCTRLTGESGSATVSNADYIAACTKLVATLLAALDRLAGKQQEPWR